MKTKYGILRACPAQPLGMRVGEAGKTRQVEGQVSPRQVLCEGRGARVQGDTGPMTRGQVLRANLPQPWHHRL